MTGFEPATSTSRTLSRICSNSFPMLCFGFQPAQMGREKGRVSGISCGIPLQTRRQQCVSRNHSIASQNKRGTCRLENARSVLDQTKRKHGRSIMRSWRTSDRSRRTRQPFRISSSVTWIGYKRIESLARTRQSVTTSQSLRPSSASERRSRL